MQWTTLHKELLFDLKGILLREILPDVLQGEIRGSGVHHNQSYYFITRCADTYGKPFYRVYLLCMFEPYKPTIKGDTKFMTFNVGYLYIFRVDQESPKFT